MKNLIFITLIFTTLALANNNNDKKEIYIIKLKNQGLVHYAGTINGYKATSPAIVGGRKLNVKSKASQKYLKYLQELHGELKSSISQHLHREIGKTLDYYYAKSGMALYLSADEVSKLKDLDGIISIEKDKIYELSTDAGPTFLHANQLWDASAMPNNMPNQGEGIVVGVIDTGANMGHVSFAENAEDNYDFAAANPLGAGNFIGACNGTTVICNNKHIGAWDFADTFPPAGQSENDGPDDSNGHGTHTASTAVGNKISAPVGGFITVDNRKLNAPFISGVAPHAHLINYDVCVDSCSSAAISAAIDQAIADSVDVISFSISGGFSPWADGDRDFLDAVAAGILVSTAAGNTSPSVTNPVGNVNHRGPWLLSVANSSHNRVSSNNVSITAPNPVPTNLVDMIAINGATNNFSGDVNANLSYSGDVDSGNEDGCSAFPANSLVGKIALIVRGSCNFSVKINNADTAGAIAAIIYNNVSDVPFAMGGVDATSIPAVMLGLSNGTDIVAFINAVNAGDVQAFVSGTVLYEIIESLGDILNPSSLIGPNNTFDVTKPDINAPGTAIFAGFAGNSTAYAYLSGTSMATPHISGSAALMIAAQPTWTPNEIQSAMMMTARHQNKRNDGSMANADDVGSGTLDLAKAVNSPLVMNETFANFVAASSNPSTLNIPSLRSNSCNDTCAWTRTVTNKSNASLTWTSPALRFVEDANLQISPSNFTLAPGESQSLTFLYTVCGGTLNTLRFSDFVLSPSDTSLPSSRITLAVKPTGTGTCTLSDLIFANAFE